MGRHAFTPCFMSFTIVRLNYHGGLLSLFHAWYGRGSHVDFMVVVIVVVLIVILVVAVLVVVMKWISSLLLAVSVYEMTILLILPCFRCTFVFRYTFVKK